MGLDKIIPYTVRMVKAIQKSGCDVICIIDRQVPHELEEQFKELRSFDKAFDSFVSCFKSSKLDLPIVYAPLPELTDYHDVRCFQEAAAKSIERAMKSGFKAPLLWVPQNKLFPHAELCTILGALNQLYVPIQCREDDTINNEERIRNLYVLMQHPESESVVKDAVIFESGRFIARDIAGGDPERMAAMRIEEYVTHYLKELQVTVIKGVDKITKEYPLFAAVNRAANQVERHQGRIIYLEYKAPQRAKKTLMLVGKGVTYDTGGADIKAGGVMAGMSRDKSGAAAVAGFMQIVNTIKPKDINVIGALCLVRNSVGEESYVADEIIKSRAGVRVRVGNTDAEGRMCMADALCRMKELAIEENLPDPHLFTVATLTGHAYLAAGDGYSIAMDNSVAYAAGHCQLLQSVGQAIGEPFELSVLRQDDFDFNNKNKKLDEDIIQCNNLASSRTPRGHQIPAAFLIQVTGLDKHGLNSSRPLKYTHLDIAASSGIYPNQPTAVPILALAKTHLC